MMQWSTQNHVLSNDVAIKRSLWQCNQFNNMVENRTTRTEVLPGLSHPTFRRH